MNVDMLPQCRYVTLRMKEDLMFLIFYSMFKGVELRAQI